MTPEPSVDVLAAQVREGLRRASVFLDDALEESDLTENEMYEAPGTFYVRLLASKTSLAEIPEALDVLVGYAKRAETAEQTIQVLLAVLPQLIAEGAEDFKNAYLDGREPDLREAAIRERLDRIVREKFA